MTFSGGSYIGAHEQVNPQSKLNVKYTLYK